MENMNQAFPPACACYVLLHPRKGPEMARSRPQADRLGKKNSRWPEYIDHGATAKPTKVTAKNTVAESRTGVARATRREEAAVEALYYARTSRCFVQRKRLSVFQLVTYFQFISTKRALLWAINGGSPMNCRRLAPLIDAFFA
jgi:hypothetical protein